MSHKTLKNFLHRALPPWIFELLQNGHRKRLRAAGRGTEVHVSGFGSTRRVNGCRDFHCRPTEADAMTFRQVFQEQEYNMGYLPHGPAIIRLYQEMEEEPLILDCGGNIGASAVFLAESFPKARIFAIEPDAANFAMLEKNVAAHPLVKGLHAAVGHEDGWMKIANPEGAANSFRAEKSAEGHGTVKAYSIPTLVAMANARPFFLKVDIEGGEDTLFTTHWETLDRFPVVAVEIHDWLYRHQATSRNFLKWHVRGDRDLVIRGEMLYSISNTLVSDPGGND